MTLFRATLLASAIWAVTGSEGELLRKKEVIPDKVPEVDLLQKKDVIPEKVPDPLVQSSETVVKSTNTQKRKKKSLESANIETPLDMFDHPMFDLLIEEDIAMSFPTVAPSVKPASPTSSPSKSISKVFVLRFESKRKQC